MDLYGINDALNSVNQFSQFQSEANEDIRQNNLDLDKAINDAKNTAIAQKEGISEEQTSKDANTIMGQAAQGIGLKSALSKVTEKVPKNVENIVAQTTDVKVPVTNPVDPEFADVNAVLENENIVKDASRLGGAADRLKGVVKSGTAFLGDSSKLLGAGGAVISGGMALQQDIAGGLKGFEKMNWEDQIGNILQIGGSTAELAGIAVPTPASLGLEAIGGLANILGSGLSEIGGALDEKSQKAQADSAKAVQTAKLQSEKMGSVATASTASLGGVGGAPIVSQISQATGSF
jgi:hypothetical protein|tara:strand:+ start:10336 stop:11208 length:873 start_codon:yes stop_codon:yes gene_type:complete